MFNIFLWACRQGHESIVEKLLPVIDPSDLDNHAIYLSSCHGHTQIVKLLLNDKRVDPSACSNTAIRWAGENGHTKIVELLKGVGCEENSNRF